MFNPLETLETRELFSAVPGIYSGGELLSGDRYAIQADANVLPSVRNALDEGRVDIEVVLDPGETYFLQPLTASEGKVINDLYLSGDTLSFRADPEADADGSGGRANLLVERNIDGVRKFPFIINAAQGGELGFDGVDLSAVDHRAGEYIRFVVNYGAGGVTLENSSIAPPLPVAEPSNAGPIQEPVNDSPVEEGQVDLGMGAETGIYERGMLLTDEQFAVEEDTNILPAIRRALDAGHLDILVALDPDERYYLNPQEEAGLPRINDIYLNGADLRIAAIEETDADGSGGRADLVVQRNQSGGYNNPFYLNTTGSGNLDLENVDLRAEGRQEGEFIGFITHRGDGLVRLINSTVEQPTRDFGLAAVATPSPVVAVTPDPELPTVEVAAPTPAEPVVSEPVAVLTPEPEAPVVVVATPTPAEPVVSEPVAVVTPEPEAPVVVVATPTPAEPVVTEPVAVVSPEPEAPVLIEPEAVAGPVTPGTGIYLLDGTLLAGYEIRSNTNILPVIRAVMDQVSKEIEVRLDPGETYYFEPTEANGRFIVGNLSLAGADLRIVAADSADANGSGGFAEIEVGPSNEDSWATIFHLGDTSEASLLLDGLSLSMPDRQPDDFVDFIVWRGGGDLTVRDSKLSGARNNIDASGFGGPNGEGVDILIDRSLITYSYAPDRDLEYAPGKTGGPANGIYARNYNTLMVQDSVFFHNGWTDEATLNTHASAYSHGLYLSNGDRDTFDPNNTRLINTIFSDNGANAAQLRQGGIVQDSFFFNSPFGINLTAGEVSGSAFASGDAVWPRDGATTTGYQRWIDRGGFAIQIDQDSSIETNRLGPITIQDNVFADATAGIVAQDGRSPILNETDAARPQTLSVSNNYELNWVDYQPGGRIQNYSGEGIDRFNTGSTALNGAFGSSFTTVEQIIEAAVTRDRGEYGTNGVPEARDLAAFYFQRALAAAS